MKMPCPATRTDCAPRAKQGAAPTRAAGDKPAAVVTLVALVLLSSTGCERAPDAGAADRARLTRGANVYETHCASCHGFNLEGQPDWRSRRPDGKLPAPPHDESGHTWHHADQVLFDLVKNGVASYGGPGYVSDMPAYAGKLSDEEIHAVLAYIKSRWPAHIRDKQARIDAAQRSAK
jgi:mono/diheme cytochrome c family protein